MYNDFLDTKNKIFTSETLEKIFDVVNDKKNKIVSQYEQEKIRNKDVQYDNQTWTVGNLLTNVSATINFYDNSEIGFDNYDRFIEVFHSRMSEIKTIYFHYYSNYSVKSPNTDYKHLSNKIFFHITEDSVDFNFDNSNEDKIIDEIYESVKQIVSECPERNDDIIKSKNKIVNRVGFGISLIPSIIISTLLLFVPIVKDIIFSGYIVYPSMCGIMGFFLSMFCNNKIQELYNHIIKDKKYIGYDSNLGKSVYGDDMEKFVSKSEVLIGENVNNLKYRDEIREMDKKYGKYVPMEIITIITFSLLIIFVNYIINR